MRFGRWPYAYYMLLRVVVMGAAFLLAGLVYQQAKNFTIWIGLFLIVAIVFNSILPPHLTRHVWAILNLASAALFAVAFLSYPQKSNDLVCLHRPEDKPYLPKFRAECPVGVSTQGPGRSFGPPVGVPRPKLKS